MNDSKKGNRHTSTRHQGRRRSIRAHILDILKRNGVYDLEELVRLCSSYTWNQVFLEVDRLSRTGELRLVSRRPGVYTVTLRAQAA